MKFGVCYYPEHWSRDQWALDAQMMAAAGLSLVRLAEFAWARLEPAAGQYDWEWLDQAIALFAEAGLEVVLGTPTAAPPVWLTKAHPEIYRVDANGRRRQHGTRRHICPNSPQYRHSSRLIVQKMAARYGRDPRISGWQIDNEFGGGKSSRCYCPHCARAFAAWLQQRYGLIDRLNQAWGTVFWSQTYSDWVEIPLPDDRIDKKNPSHQLDYFRFCSDSIVAYQNIQVEVLQAACENQFVTHNFMGLFPDLNQFELAAALDFISWDSYPTGNPERWQRYLTPVPQSQKQTEADFAYDVGQPYFTGLAHDLMRGLKQKSFWVMEQQCGHINWGALNQGIRPGTTRLWTWHALAAGADTMVFFRWRAALLAQEQYHSGLLRHDRTTAVGYADLLSMQAEREMMAQVAAQPCQAEVAILFNYDDLWAIQLQPHRQDFTYLGLVFAYYEALQKSGIPVDIVPPSADLKPYKLVLAASAHLVDEKLFHKLQAYVRQGGWLYLGIRSGFKTESNLVTDLALPGLLRPLTGAAVTDWQSLPEGIGWDIKTEIPGLRGPATRWLETLQTDTAAPLAAYETGQAAFSENKVEDGRVFYLGFYPQAGQATAVINYLTSRLGIEPVAELTPGLLAAKRGKFVILLNFSDKALTAVVNQKSVIVPARDVDLVFTG